MRRARSGSSVKTADSARTRSGRCSASSSLTHAAASNAAGRRLKPQSFRGRARQRNSRQSTMIASRGDDVRRVEPMRNRFARHLIALVLCCACPNPSAYSQPSSGKEPKKVLALHLVRRDSPAFDDTFRAELSNALSGQLDYYSEYIDLTRLGDEKYHTALRNYLRERYVADGVDLVIASGPSVVSFLNEDRTLFQSVPIVFTTRPGLLAEPPSTGIISEVDLASTVSAALKAQPDTRHVFVVTGVAPV